MTKETVQALTLKRLMELNRSIGVLADMDMLAKLQLMTIADPAVAELINLGQAQVRATNELKRRLAEHQAAYDATLPLQKFQTYEEVWSGDGDSEPNVNYGVYEARTAKHAVAMAHAVGETQVTGAHPAPKEVKPDMNAFMDEFRDSPPLPKLDGPIYVMPDRYLDRHEREAERARQDEAHRRAGSAQHPDVL